MCEYKFRMMRQNDVVFEFAVDEDEYGISISQKLAAYYIWYAAISLYTSSCCYIWYILVYRALGNGKALCRLADGGVLLDDVLRQPHSPFFR